jgi:hypothetical protein
MMLLIDGSRIEVEGMLWIDESKLEAEIGGEPEKMLLIDVSRIDVEGMFWIDE